MKRVLKIVGIIIAILIVIAIALPFIINVNMFRPQIEAQLTSALGRQVTIGNLKLSLIQGSVSADDLSIADDPSFSRSPFVKAKALNVGVEMMPLIFDKKLNVTNLNIDRPQVSLIHNATGKWNFSSIGSASSGASSGQSGARPATEGRPANAAEKKPQTTESGARPENASKAGGGSTSPSSNPNLSVGKLTVTNGSVSVAEAGTGKKPQVYNNVDITVKDFAFTSQFPFTLSASLPGGGTAKLDGKAGPIDASDASLTPMESSIAIKGLDLANSGFVDPSSGFGGLVNFNGNVKSNGHEARTNGTAVADKLKLSPKGTPASKSVTVKYATVYEMQKQSGQLAQGDVSTGQAVAHLTGGYQVQPATTVLNMKLNADNMPVNDLEPLLPAMGVSLPSGSSLQGGTLSANLGIVGPVDKLVITGPVKLANTKLAGFSLGSKLAAVSKLTGGGGQTGNDTVIQNFSTDVRVAPEGINTQNVNLNVPSLGVVTGSGTISPQNALNYTMNANLSGGTVTGLTQMAGMGNKGASLPFFIQGTTSDPKIVPNVKGIVNSELGNLAGSLTKGQGQGQQNPANNVINSLGGLLGGKKKQK
jgi:AsmA protein